MKTRTITIPKKDILFDVDSVTHIFSRTLEGKDVKLADAVSSDTKDTFSEKVVTRYADRRYAELRDRLARFLTTETVTTAEVAISTATSYSFSFNLETGFQDELMMALANELESYIATGAVSDWFYAVGNEQGPAFAKQLEPKLGTILTYLTKRKFPTRV